MALNTQQARIDLTGLEAAQQQSMEEQAASNGMTLESWALWMLVNHADEIVANPELRNAAGLKRFSFSH